jgi:hypothetical protein
MRRKKPVRLVPKRYQHDPWYYQITGETPPGPATVLQWRSQAEAAPDNVDRDVVPAPDAADGDGGDSED